MPAVLSWPLVQDDARGAPLNVGERLGADVVAVHHGVVEEGAGHVDVDRHDVRGGAVNDAGRVLVADAGRAPALLSALCFQ